MLVEHAGRWHEHEHFAQRPRLDADFVQAFEFPECDHRNAPSRQGERLRGDPRRPTSRGMPRKVGRYDETGENSTPIIREDSTPAHIGLMMPLCSAEGRSPLENDPKTSTTSWIQFEADSLQDRPETRSLVWAGARLSTNYFVMNAAATLIAGYGLLANSEAVIIGAMLIAMLYGPILGIGLALAELEVSLLYRSVVTETIGAAWVFGIGYALGWFHGNVPVTDEMLARTAPNILDLMIAFVGGAAGAYATASTRISSAVVGVAIATALCPPLTACGILLSHGYPQLAAGAALLFFTNLVAIAVAAMATFLVLGHKAVRVGGGLGGTWIARTVARQSYRNGGPGFG